MSAKPHGPRPRRAFGDPALALVALATAAFLGQGVAHAQASVSEEQTSASHGSEPNWMLVGIGGGIFLGEYLGELALTAATGGSANELEQAAIPLAGPWLELANDASKPWWEVGLTAYEGVMQVAALTLVAVGLAWQRPVRPAALISIALRPLAFARGGGLSLGGSFR